MATIPTKADDIIKDGKLLGAYAEELNHIVTRNYKPKNITEAKWTQIKSWLKNRPNWNGYTNIFKATADEIVEAATKIKNYRTANNLKGKNEKERDEDLYKP